MKRLAFVLAVAACSKAENKVDTTTPAMAPAPAPAATPAMDSATMKAKADSAHKDSVDKKLIKP